MSKKITVVSVDISTAFRGAFNEEKFKGILDMLRFSGVLRSNVKDFPKIIEYVDTNSDGSNDVARWASFGYKATARLEYS